MEMNQNPVQIKVKMPDEVLRGSYANQISVMHTKDDFVIDFIAAYPPEGVVNSRIITNPVALKRMAFALMDNINKYEEKFGEIDIGSSNISGVPINSNIN